LRNDNPLKLGVFAMNMTGGLGVPVDAAMRLIIAITRLRARGGTGGVVPSGGLTSPQVIVLYRIAESGSVTASELAASEHVSHQSVTHTVASLKAKGLVEGREDPDDRRCTVLSATEKGQAFVETFLDSGTPSWRALSTPGTGPN
jgi:DNA-binding MarR family transcriptional regulator